MTNPHDPHGSASIRRQSERHTEALSGLLFDDAATDDGEPMTREMTALLQERMAA